MRGTAVAILSIAALAPAAHGDLVSIAASRDATLYQSTDGTLANGAGQYLFAGRTNQGLTRRGVLWFDIAAFVPADATLTSVRLVLNVSQANGGNRTMTVHRALTAWTTGASDPDSTEASGAQTLAGDATWLHASADGAGGGTLWQNIGGDFAAAASASSRHNASSLGELAGDDAELAAEGVERLSAEEPQDDLGLAAAGPSSAVGGMVLAVAFVGSARAPRSLRRRRRLVSWLLHGVVHCALQSQMGVSANCAAHQASRGGKRTPTRAT